MRTAMVLGICLLSVGCSKDSILMTRMPEVGMNLKASPVSVGPGNPATITAEAFNYGRTTIWRNEGCSYWGPGMSLQVYFGTDPNQVYLWNPLTVPLCPDGKVRFSPGEQLKSAVQFDGNLFGPSGNHLDAQTGTYTVVVRFGTWTDGETWPGTVIERRVSLQWSSK